MTTNELVVEILERHHDHLWFSLPLLVTAGRRAARERGPQAGDRLTALIGALQAVLLTHLTHEDRVLLDLAHGSRRPEVEDGVHRLRREHIELHDCLVALEAELGPGFVTPAAGPLQRAVGEQLAELRRQLDEQIRLEEIVIRRRIPSVRLH